MGGMPDAAIGGEGEPVGCRSPRFGHPEVDPCRAHADGQYGHRAGGPTDQGRRQSVVRRLEGAQGREPRAAGQQDAGVDGGRGEGESRIGLLGRGLTKEPGAPGPAGQRSAGEGAYPQGGQPRQLQTPGHGTLDGSGVRQHQRFIPEGQGGPVIGAGRAGG